jgi:hypothetical protein
LNIWVVDQVLEVVGKGTARESDCEITSFGDSVTLSFGDKVG